MKRTLFAAALVLAVSQAFGAVTIQYYNRDSKAYKMKVRMDGSDKEVTFDASKTAHVTIQGGGKICVVETKCGKVEVKDGAKIEIKDGCIKVTN